MTGFSARVIRWSSCCWRAGQQAQTQRFPAFDPERIFMLGDADLDGRLSLDEYRDFLRTSPRMRNAAAHDRADVPPARRGSRRVPLAGGVPQVVPAEARRRGREAGRTEGEAAGAATPEVAITPEQEQFFEAKIRPVLVTQCGKCHASTAEKLRGGLRLDSREGLRLGGDSGPAIVPGKPDESLLIRAIRYRDEELQDAPQGEAPRRGRRGLRGLDQDGRPRPADRADRRRGAPCGRSREGAGVLVVPAAEEVRPALGEAGGLAARRHRPLPPRGARSPRARPGRRRRPAEAPPPGDVRPHRPPAHARGARRLPRGRLARRLREGRRSAARLAPLRRTLGPALARRGPLSPSRAARRTSPIPRPGAIATG